MIHFRDAFIFLLVSNALTLIGATTLAYAPDFRLPITVALDITAATFLTAAVAVLPLVVLNIRAALKGGAQ